MTWLIRSIVFLFGLSVGSFLNVLIDRLPNGQNPFRGRSHCDFCKKTLSPVELIPLLSYMRQKGCCAGCHKKLSFQYPLVEAISGVMFLFLFNYTVPTLPRSLAEFPFSIYQFSMPVQFFALAVVFSAFLVIFVSDAKYQIIPDETIIVGIIGSLLYVYVSGASWTNILASSALAGGFLGMIYYITKGRGMGFGDVKLAFLLGLFLGFPRIVIALYAAFLTGGMVSIILILCKIKRLKSKIAFGPFLVAGGVFAYIWGDIFGNWYSGFVR